MKSASPAADSLAQQHQRDLADEFGALDAEIAIFKPKIRKHEKLREEIQTLFDAAPADAISSIQGERFTAIVGARKQERKIFNMRGLFKLWGAKAFLELCSVGLDKFDALVKEEKRPLYVAQTQTGKRPVESAPNAPAPKTKAA